jgi:acetylornithine deacetylase/succinyl-diaminopimelate desuccinylase-like protein
VCAASLISPDQLLADLQKLCAQPSSSGHPEELVSTARLVADMLRRLGLRVKTVHTPGAPVVLAWQEGDFSSRLLLYHHYDAAPTGPWRAWFHEPFQTAERDDVMYGRGVAHGKGALAAHMQVLRAQQQNGVPPACGLVLVIEGEGMIGSPHLADVISEHAGELHADGCLSTAGERDAHGRPICYGGSKGLLQVRLDAAGATHPLPSGLAASVPNPVWRLNWALNQIKGEDEDIRINGFYDSIGGPVKDERELLRDVRLDEAGRLAAWDIPAFLFNLSGIALARSEVTLPTCNITSFSMETSSEVPSIPVSATAKLDFHLVPQQQPETIFALLGRHFEERGFTDIALAALPGGYPPVRTEISHPFVQQIIAAASDVYENPVAALPLGMFVQPLHCIAAQLNLPVATLALARSDSAIHGSNERIPIDDLVRHGKVLEALLTARQPSPSSLEAPS